jgi:anti-anti-sigma factor
MHAQVAGVFSDAYPVQWLGSQAVVTLPEHVDVSNAGQIREELLSVINRGADAVIADMSATASCDHAGADAMARAYQRAVVSGTQIRLVVTAQIVRRVLSIRGLDRLISIYPSLEGAIAAGAPAAVSLASGPASTEASGEPSARRTARAWRPQRRAAGPRNAPRNAAITPAVLWQLIDALTDGVALADDDGVLALANRRLGEMFGYEPNELIGRPVESLIPADLRTVHRSHRSGYAQAPKARPMAAGARLVGLRKDGATFPVEISLSPVPTATGQFTLAVVRDVTEARRRDDLVELARAAVAEQAHRGQELLDRIVNSLFRVGVSLQAAIDQPGDVARERIAEALGRLDDAIRETRDHIFAPRGHDSQPPQPPADGGQ